MKIPEYWICDLELSTKKIETYVLNEPPIRPASFVDVYHVIEKSGFDELLEKTSALAKALNEIEGLSQDQLLALKAWHAFEKDRL